MVALPSETTHPALGRVAKKANESQHGVVHEVSPAPPLDDAGIERALDQLAAIIRSQGLRRSAVRDRIARAALARQGHFTVDELIGDLRRDGGGDAHPATVYRVVPLLVEAGLLKPTLITEGDGSHYERAFEREHHDHLICTACGKVVEFHFEAIEVLQDDIASRFGFELTNHVHELQGICPTCRSGD